MSEPRSIRKQTGNFLEDFRPGQVFRHRGGKTLTEGLFTTFTEFAMTSNPLAKNARYARAYGFDGLVSSPGLVTASAVPVRPASTSQRPVCLGAVASTCRHAWRSAL